MADPVALLIYLALGASAGLLAGLLGVGGGLILVAGLAWLLPLHGIPATQVMPVALATSLASIVLTGLSSARAHHRRGSVGWPMVAWLGPGLALGAWIGVDLALLFSSATLRRIVAGYCLLTAAQMALTRTPVTHATRPEPRGFGLSLAGAGIGAVSAVVGIGGGSMTVPLLVWRGVDTVRAVATSSVCGVAIALASASRFALHAVPMAMPRGVVGYVFVPAALAIALASVGLAPLGAALAHRLGGPRLSKVFALFLVAIGASLLWS